MMYAQFKTNSIFIHTQYVYNLDVSSLNKKVKKIISNRSVESYRTLNNSKSLNIII